MKFFSSALAALVTVSALGLAAQTQAATYEHVHDLASTLQSQSRQLYNEFRLHYRSSHDYSHLMSDAASLNRQARRLHEEIDEGTSRRDIENHVRQLDRTFHHLEDLVAHIEDDRHDDFDRDDLHHDDFDRDIGQSYDIRHVRRLMRSVEDTIHHMREDVAGSRNDVGIADLDESL